MNIQTERLENHMARLTVEVEPEKLEDAKRVAAGRLAKRVNIPGFRKGKAPYRILVSYLGESAIIEDAVEVLGNQVYKDVLDQSGIEPYGPGELEDFTLDPQPIFKFVVPLRPSVDLGDYRAVRVEYQAPVIEDEAVNKALEALRERHAVIDESHQPVATGNRVTLNMTGRLLDVEEDEEEDAEDDDAEPVQEVDETSDIDSDDADDEEEDEDDEAEEDDDVFIQRDDMIFMLTEDREPVPGFTEKLLGAVVDERREFDLTYPENEEEFGTLSGHHVKFDVTVKKIESVTLPALTDDFAARVTANEEKPLTLLELRMRTRENLLKNAEESAKAEYADKVLHEMMERATVSFPEMLVDEQIKLMLQQVDADLRQRGLTLEDYMKVSQKTMNDLKADYRDQAIHTIEHVLVTQEIISAEKIEASEELLNEETERIAAQFGDQADRIRKMYNRPDARKNLRNELTNRLVMEHISAIARGDLPTQEAGPTQAETSPSESFEASE